MGNPRQIENCRLPNRTIQFTYQAISTDSTEHAAQV